jgi:hypothetical protein
MLVRQRQNHPADALEPIRQQVVPFNAQLPSWNAEREATARRTRASYADLDCQKELSDKAPSDKRQQIRYPMPNNGI